MISKTNYLKFKKEAIALRDAASTLGCINEKFEDDDYFNVIDDINELQRRFKELEDNVKLCADKTNKGLSILDTGLQDDLSELIHQIICWMRGRS